MWLRPTKTYTKLHYKLIKIYNYYIVCCFVSDMGAIQARKIKARRHQSEQTWEPFYISIYVHHTMLFSPPQINLIYFKVLSIGLTYTILFLKKKIKKKEKQRKIYKFVDQIIVVWIFGSTCFHSEKLIITSTRTFNWKKKSKY